MNLFQFSFLTFALFLASCAPKGSKTKTKLNLTGGAVVNFYTSFEGGLLVYGNHESGATFKKFISAGDDTVELLNGSWTFYGVGWKGINTNDNNLNPEDDNFRGVTKCAERSTALIDSSNNSVDISFTTGACDDVEYGGTDGVDGSGYFKPFELLNCNKNLYGHDGKLYDSTASPGNEYNNCQTDVGSIRSFKVVMIADNGEISSSCFDNDQDGNLISDRKSTDPNGPLPLRIPVLSNAGSTPRVPVRIDVWNTDDACSGVRSSFKTYDSGIASLMAQETGSSLRVSTSEARIRLLSSDLSDPSFTTPYATLSFSPSSYDFGQVMTSQSRTQVFTLKNHGGQSATTITGDAFSPGDYDYDGGSYPGIGGTCGATLAPGATCTVVIIYNPSTEAAHFDDLTLSFKYNGTNTYNFSVKIDGEGIPPAGVSPSAISGNTTEAGATATFTVSIDTQPTDDVVVTVISDDVTEGSVSSTTLTFTDADWSTDQTVTVTGVDDPLADGNVTYTISFSVASSDTDYNGITVPTVSVTNNNDDTAGVTVSTISGNTTEAGGQATFTVVLDAEPSDDVTINLSSDAITEGVVSPANLTFTPSNWASAQTATVTGQNDDYDDGDVPYNVLTATITGTSDGAYLNMDPADVPIINVDDDTAGFILSKTTLNTSEAGTSDTFTITLKSEPTSNVNIVLTSSDTNEVADQSVTILAATWSTPMTVIVTGVDDFIDDGNQSVTLTTTASSTDGNYNGLPIDDITLTNTDNDTAGFDFSITSGTTTEVGGTQVVTVRLNSEPVGDVVIDFATSDSTEGTVFPSNLTLDNSNWSSGLSVTVTGVDDAIDDGNAAYSIATTINAGLTTASAYGALNPPDVAMINTDDDTFGVTINNLSGNTTEAGGQATFDVFLKSEPTDTVTFDLTSNDISEGTLNFVPVTLIFNVGNWSSPQPVTITGVNDTDSDGDVTYKIITDTIISSDSNYGGHNPADLNVVNEDDEGGPGIQISAISGSVSEDGNEAVFSLVLTTEPTASVNLAVGTTDSNIAEINGAASQALTFTTGDWNTPKPITVSGVDDQIDNGDRSFDVTFTNSSSLDGDYNNLPLNNITFVNVDDDEAGVNVTAISTNTLSEAGGVAIYSVSLNSEPTDPVTINVSSSSPTEGMPHVNSLIFDNTNWFNPQPVTVTAQDDTIVDGDVSFNIINSDTSAGTSEYDSLDVPDFLLTNEDDDVLASLSFNTTTANFNKVLVGQTVELPITLTASAGTVTATNFSAANHSAPFSIAWDGCASLTLAASASCTFKLIYSPTVSGAHTDTIDITYVNDGGSNTVTESIELSGEGVDSPTVSGISTSDSIVTLNGSSTNLIITVTFNQDIQVNGVPRIFFTNGAYANYVAGGAANEMRFEYNIGWAHGDLDLGATQVINNPKIELNRGSVTLNGFPNIHANPSLAGHSIISNNIYVDNTISPCDAAENSKYNGISNGTGLAHDPYIICNFDQLQMMANKNGAGTIIALQNNDSLQGHFRLMRDIDGTNDETSMGTGLGTWNGGEGFSPIGQLSPGLGFKGVFDGFDSAIYGLVIYPPIAVDGIGMFAQLDPGSKVSNLYFEDLYINSSSGSGAYRVGAIAGNAIGAVINNITIGSNSFVYGDTGAGGIVGNIEKGLLQNIQSDATVGQDNIGSSGLGGISGNVTNSSVIGTSFYGSINTPAATNAGGISGVGTSSKFIDNFVNPIVMSGGNTTGGLVGYLANSSISQAEVLASSISASSDFIGGLAGISNNSKIYDSSVSTDIIGGGSSIKIGGLIGEMQNVDNEVISSYFDGAIFANNAAGGIVGQANTGSGHKILDSFVTLGLSNVTNNDRGAIGGNVINGNLSYLNSHFYSDPGNDIRLRDCFASGSGLNGVCPGNEGNVSNFYNSIHPVFSNWDDDGTWFLSGSALPKLFIGGSNEATRLGSLGISGAGTKDDPIIIDTVAKWNQIGDKKIFMNKYIELTSLNYNFFGGFTPIGSEKSPFTGVLYSESGSSFLNITLSRNEHNLGVVRVGVGAKISGLTIDTSDFSLANGSGNRNLGAFVGLCEHCQLERLSLIDTFVGINTAGDVENVGGIIGHGLNTKVFLCETKGGPNSMRVRGQKNIGGIAGVLASHSNLSQSYAQGEVASNTTAGAYVGGLGGEIFDSKLSFNISQASVSGSLGGAAGLVGAANNSEVKNSISIYPGVSEVNFNNGSIFSNIEIHSGSCITGGCSSLPNVSSLQDGSSTTILSFDLQFWDIGNTETPAYPTLK